jgi:hypothetical protein
MVNNNFPTSFQFEAIFNEAALSNKMSVYCKRLDFRD